MSNRIKLLPCPICGKQPTVSEEYDEAVKWYDPTIECKGCMLGNDWHIVGYHHLSTGGYITLTKAKKQWNKLVETIKTGNIKQPTEGDQ